MQEKQKFVTWFYNLPIRHKQLLGLFTSELISVVGLVGVGIYLIVTGGRYQLIQQAKSEIAVNEIKYNIKINQMGFGFRGQSDNAAIIAAAQAHANGELISSSLEQQVIQILQNEIRARNIEYATLVGQDLKIIANANADRTRETFNPNNLVSEVLAQADQIKTSERLDWLELMREAPPLAGGMVEQDLLIRYTATPVRNPQTKTVIGVLISGDIVNGKPAIVEETVDTLNGGYSGVFLYDPSDKFVEVAAFSADETEPNNSKLLDQSLLRAAVANPSEIVTGRERIGTQTYTVAAKALLNYAGVPVAVLVRGTSENALNALLTNSLSTQLIITILALTADIALAILLSFAMIEPIRRLQKTTQEFANGDLNARAEVLATDEVGQLTATFNEMADHLADKNSKLKAQADKQKRLNARLSKEVAERKEAEAVLQKSEAELKQKNQMLEQRLPEIQSPQAQVIESERISNLEELVAGVTHEINNPVSFIHGNLSHLEEYTQTLFDYIKLYQKHYPNPDLEIQTEAEEMDIEFIEDDLPKILDSMMVGTQRIREIVLSLRNFSRINESEFTAVNIHEGIENALSILQHRLQEQLKHPEIKVIKEYGNLPLVECYSGLLNQVFLNILANAIDALEEAIRKQTAQEIQENPSKITIQTSVIQSDWVEISITDNGIGIPQEFLHHIFDPLYTTKSIRKGTGMGMLVSYQIITEKHGGKLECFSTPGTGTTFIIRIPVQQKLPRKAIDAVASVAKPIAFPMDVKKYFCFLGDGSSLG